MQYASLPEIPVTGQSTQVSGLPVMLAGHKPLNQYLDNDQGLPNGCIDPEQAGMSDCREL
jgi:hypothetical protein